MFYHIYHLHFHFILYYYYNLRSRGSSVDIVTELRAGWQGIASQQRQRSFLFASASKSAMGPPTLLFSGYRRRFPRG